MQKPSPEAWKILRDTFFPFFHMARMAREIIRGIAGLLRGKPVTGLVLLALLFAIPAQSDAAIRVVSGTVVSVSDGDSITVVTPEQTKLRIRLYGIDAPETQKGNVPGQPYGDEARKALATALLHRQVEVEIIDIDRYRRMVSIVRLEGENINLSMVRSGYAEAYREYLKPPYRDTFLAAEQSARNERIGIWSLPDYQRPQAFRRQ